MLTQFGVFQPPPKMKTVPIGSERTEKIQTSRLSSGLMFHQGSFKHTPLMFQPSPCGGDSRWSRLLRPLRLPAISKNRRGAGQTFPSVPRRQGRRGADVH